MKNLSILLSALFFTACASTSPARHVSSRQYETKSSQDFANFSTVTGTYRGVLKNRDGAEMGALELSLMAVQVPIAEGTGANGGGRAILGGNVKVVSGARTGAASVTQGSFVPSDGTNEFGSVEATINVTLLSDNSGSTVTFLLVGALDRGHLTGTITPTGVSGHPGSFDLVKDADMPKVSAPTWESPKSYAGVYKNTTCQKPEFKNSIFCHGSNPDQSPVTMTVDTSAPNDGYAFVNLFADVKTCRVQMVFGQVTMRFSKAELDSGSGNITFNGVADGDTANSSLTCVKSGAGYACDFGTDASGTQYSFNLAPVGPPAGR